MTRQPAQSETRLHDDQANAPGEIEARSQSQAPVSADDSSDVTAGEVLGQVQAPVAISTEVPNAQTLAQTSPTTAQEKPHESLHPEFHLLTHSAMKQATPETAPVNALPLNSQVDAIESAQTVPLAGVDAVSMLTSGAASPASHQRVIRASRVDFTSAPSTPVAPPAPTTAPITQPQSPAPAPSPPLALDSFAESLPAIESEPLWSNVSIQMPQRNHAQPSSAHTGDHSTTVSQGPDSATTLVVASSKPDSANAQAATSILSIIRSATVHPMEQPAVPLPPAAVRAQQVDATIRLEQAIDQPVTPTLAALHSQPANGSGGSNPQALANNQMVTSTLADGLLDSGNDERFSPQLVRGLSAMLSQRGGTMTLRLTPPDLGDLRIQMTIQSGNVSAEFQASTVQAQSLLERNMAVLRHALEGQGLSIERLTVHAAPLGQQTLRDDSSNPHSNSNHAQQRSQQDAAGGESRGRHEQTAREHGGTWREAEFASLFDESGLADFRSRLSALGAES